MSGHSIIDGICIRCNQKPRPGITQEMRDAYFCTATGVQLHLLDPCLEDLNLYDMAHGLAGINRFAGHHWGSDSSSHYSIAEHSYWVSYRVGPLHQKWGLLHDASEGLGFSDMISPLKRFCPDYKSHEKWMMHCVSKKWLDGSDEPPEVKDADLLLLRTEQWNLQPGVPWLRAAITGLRLTDIKPQCWSAIHAKNMFIRRFIELGLKA